MSTRLAYAAAFVSLLSCVTAFAQSIRITEVMANPNLTQGGQRSGEFVELFNLSEEPVDLTGWKIGDRDTEDEIEPAKMEPPASCSDCVDKEPPSTWGEPTCAGQLASGQCAERARMADGYCMASCGACAACTVTPPVDTIHGDPMFRHNGEGFKFSIPVGRPTDLLSWGGGEGGEGGGNGGEGGRRRGEGSEWQWRYLPSPAEISVPVPLPVG